MMEIEYVNPQPTLIIRQAVSLKFVCIYVKCTVHSFLLLVFFFVSLFLFVSLGSGHAIPLFLLTMCGKRQAAISIFECAHPASRPDWSVSREVAIFHISHDRFERENEINHNEYFRLIIDAQFLLLSFILLYFIFLYKNRFKAVYNKIGIGKIMADEDPFGGQVFYFALTFFQLFIYTGIFM